MKKVSVECRNICLSYGSTDVLKDINLKVEPGEFFALLGPSGSGKSTLLRMIAGFNHPRQGQLLIDGKDFAQVPPWDRNIGMVFQSYALWPHMTVWDNIAFGLVERRLPRAQIKQRVEAALDLVGLSAMAGRRPNQLSGGQQQRVALARTIVIEPQVLLLDEPLSNLDKNLRIQMRQELLSLQRRLGITTIFVTHDQEEAMTTADRMAILNHGTVQQIGTPTALFDFPDNHFVANFVGSMNILHAKIRDVDANTITIGLGQSPSICIARHQQADIPTSCLTPGTTVSANCRPHHIRIERQAPVDSVDRTWISGTVQSSEFLGEFTRYSIHTGSERITADHPHRAGQSVWPDGASVAVGIDIQQIRIMEASHD
jgi:iron(III) transport system ATP-binding protein